MQIQIITWAIMAAVNLFFGVKFLHGWKSDGSNSSLLVGALNIFALGFMASAICARILNAR